MLPPLSSRRLLVVDDDEVMRDLLQALLSMQGYGVMLADSGAAALRLLAAEPGLMAVLTDLQMPGLEGQALVEALRHAMPREALLLGMSGSEASAETLAVLDAFLPKPFDIPGFAAAVQRAQRRREEAVAAKETRFPEAPARVSSAEQPPAPLDETIFQALGKVIPLPQLGELYELTLADVAKRHERIVAAASAGDLSLVEREAHAIKGSCGMVGATELQALATRIETGITVDTSAIAEIPAACDRLRRMLGSKLQTH